MERRFFQGILLAFVTLGLLVATLQLAAVRVGEVDLEYVIDRQLASPAGQVLFASGVNQHAFRYKMMLFERQKPQVVAIGSSRAMQVRRDFFHGSFVNLGGATNNVAEFEQVVDHLASLGHRTKLTLVLVDPWWFNRAYPGNSETADIPQFPLIVSIDLLWRAAADLRHGNWIAAARRTRNLGLYALLEDEGFESDGSYNYLGTLTGEHKSTDVAFSDTISRIREHRSRFEEGGPLDVRYVERMCRALIKLRQVSDHVDIIAPPLSPTAWRAMERGRYGYINQAYSLFRACATPAPFFDRSDPSSVPGSTDCEFVDGLHGGDTTYARLVRELATADPAAGKYIDASFLDRFIDRYAGFAGGMSLLEHPGSRETDFLKIGCRRRN